MMGFVATVQASAYASRERLAVSAINPLQSSYHKFDSAEFVVDLHATFDNPFDAAEVQLDAHVRSPNGSEAVVPGFFYRAYTRKLVSGKEVLNPKGPPEWRVRICPRSAGPYSMVLVAKDKSGEVQSKRLRFTVAASEDQGFVRVSPLDHRYFAFDSGRPYFPVGANLAWGGDPGTFSYDRWLKADGENGANYGRLWLGPHWSTFALDVPGKASEGLGFGYFDLANAWRTDYVLNLARKEDVYLMLTLESYNTLRDKDAYPQWEKTPLNKVNGGPLETAADYWTNEVMEKEVRNRIRYVVARYGADDHVLSWEFWNEVDLTRGFRAGVVRQWHQRMGAFLKDLDPYKHLLTTSFSRSEGVPEIDELPVLDYVQTHLYTPRFVEDSALLHRQKAKDKPYYVGEVGADGGGPRAEDRQGLQLHDALWSGIAQGDSGTAMLWWWDNFINPNNLYPLFKPAQRFVATINFPAQNFRRVETDLRYAHPQDEAGTQDLEFLHGPQRFEAGDYNRPQTITIRDGKKQGSEPVPGLLHGTKNHPGLHNPITFRLDLKRPTTLEVVVGEVSGYGGARLEGTLDRKTVIDRDFPSPPVEGEPKPIKSYAETIQVEIPEGSHEVRIENVGSDWMQVGYRFKAISDRKSPPLEVYGLRGKSAAILWVKSIAYNWSEVVEEKKVPAPLPETAVEILDLPKGNWWADVWDTWKGTVVSSQRLISDGSHMQSVILPTMARDFAVRLRKLD